MLLFKNMMGRPSSQFSWLVSQTTPSELRASNRLSAIAFRRLDSLYLTPTLFASAGNEQPKIQIGDRVRVFLHSQLACFVIFSLVAEEGLED